MTTFKKGGVISKSLFLKLKEEFRANSANNWLYDNMRSHLGGGMDHLAEAAEVLGYEPDIVTTIEGQHLVARAGARYMRKLRPAVSHPDMYNNDWDLWMSLLEAAGGEYTYEKFKKELERR